MATALAVGTLLGKIAVAGAAAASIATGVMAYSSSRQQAAQVKLEQQAERTQAAIEAEERQKRLRSVLASQNAIFGSAGIDLGSGTPLSLAQDSYGEADRADRQAGLFSGVRQSVLQSQYRDTLGVGNVGLARGFLNAGSSLVNFGVARGQIGSVPNAPGMAAGALARGAY